MTTRPHGSTSSMRCSPGRQPPPKDAALIADLLSLPAGDRYPTLSLSPQQRKDKTLTALIRQLEALARERPVLMVFEDAHWSDPSSRELLDLTINRIQRLPFS